MFDLRLGLKPQHPHKPYSVRGKLNVHVYVLFVSVVLLELYALQEKFEKQLSNGWEEKVEKGARKIIDLMHFGSVSENAIKNLQMIAEE